MDAKNGTGALNQAPTARQWNEAKPEIKQHYVKNNLTLNQTMAAMEERGFSASKKQYKNHINRWRLGKNAMRQDWLAFARLHQQRQAVVGNSEIFVQIHHKIRRIQDLRRYLKNHEEQQEAFFDEAMSPSINVPSYIHVCNADGSLADLGSGDPALQTQIGATPDGHSHGDISNPSSTDVGNGLHDVPRIMNLRHGSKVLDSPHATKLNLTMAGPQQKPSHNWDAMQLSPLVTTMETKRNAHMADATDQKAPLVLFDGLDDAGHLNQLSNLNSFRTLSAGSDCDMRQNIGEVLQDRAEDGTSTNMGMAAVPNHLNLPRIASDGRPAQHAYEAACMMAAMLGAAGRRHAMLECLEEVSRLFLKMCQFHSPFILTTASIMLTWLLVHAEGSLSERIMAASFAAATEAFGPNNPVSLLLEWMTAAAARDRSKACRIGSKELRNVWQGFHENLGEVHGHTIVALYCLCFQLILADKKFLEAEGYLQQLCGVSENVFGLSCVVTINILATLSRAQLRQGKHLLALRTIDRSLAAAPLGLNHPHRLELLLRKALILRKLNRWDETEKLYWLVVKGRIATLGWKHKDTTDAHTSLVWILKERTGNWEAQKDDVHRLLVDPQVSVDEYESAWRVFMEEHAAPANEDQRSSDEDE
ncbi:hypothetical protein H2200_011915 [Cladophialophora chaetospira]|uniref:Clr5 domain-containing protein n=1 Tax=Cladophialophora chaetospira TaxID=386627 RepID=A0AA38WYZ9_9EURO|nr:hypothetical protein H2200_011915 [Cladophialophora chaetospira]